ncbi:MAG: type 1 glutamine amidotransferase [Paracoccaceae bacterium]
MPDKKPIIGILETGRLPDELTGKFGDYPSMFVRWLAPMEAEFKVYAILDGVLPKAPDECDIWLVTGSKFGTYEDHDWIAPLEQFIRDCQDAGQKMIGICFGHQIIAQALGGLVEKSTKGWGLGVHEYQATNWPDSFDPLPGGLKMQAVHQDQVNRIPQGARTIARSDFCENAAIWYPGFALTFQGHPEMAKEFVRKLIAERRGNTFPEIIADSALTTVDEPTTRKALALFVRDNLSKI